MEEGFYNISMHLYNKNILEYAQIARNGTEFKIPHIESHSSMYCLYLTAYRKSMKIDVKDKSFFKHDPLQMSQFNSIFWFLLDYRLRNK